MNNNIFISGLVVLTLGLALTTASSFLETFAVFGASTDLIRGFLDGLSVVAFGLSIILLIRSRRAS